MWLDSFKVDVTRLIVEHIRVIESTNIVDDREFFGIGISVDFEFVFPGFTKLLEAANGVTCGDSTETTRIYALDEGASFFVNVGVTLDQKGIVVVSEVEYVIDFVNKIVLVGPRKVVKGIVMVLTLSKVWVVVSICGTFSVGDVDANLPSTGTTK